MLHRKIGILTQYYNSINYGGNLQAYALVEWLNRNGFDAEQISFDYSKVPFTDHRPTGIIEKLIRLLSKSPQKIGEGLRRRYLYWVGKKKRNVYLDVVSKRRNAFKKFNKEIIRHSDQVYSCERIKESVNVYNTFIVGSDQVWNPDWYIEAFYLCFAGKNVRKISYGASISQDELNEEEKLIYKRNLPKFDYVSIREEGGVTLLKPLYDGEITHVVDPVLLLDKKDWVALALQSKINISDRYIFCYFLGDNTRIYKIIKSIAQLKGLKTVNIPCVADYYIKDNYEFGNIKCADADPIDFIKLIQDAEYVFTDSYHAILFSYIFQKQFFVIDRSSNGVMNSRIYDFLQQAGMVERFLDNRKNITISHVNSLTQSSSKGFIDYSDLEKTEISKIKERSQQFLMKALA